MKDIESYEAFHELLADVAMAKGIASPRALADLFENVSDSSASRWLSGRSAPTDKFNIMLVDALGIRSNKSLFIKWHDLLAKSRERTRKAPSAIDRENAINEQVNTYKMAFEDIDIENLAVLGDRDAPMKMFAILEIWNCWLCADFIQIYLPKIREEISEAAAAVVIVPWWVGPSVGNGGFWIHYGITCAPRDVQSDLVSRFFRREFAEKNDPAQGYNLIREATLQYQGMLSALEDRKRKDSIKFQSVNLYKIIQGGAARIFIEGQVFSPQEVDRICEALRK